MKWKRKVDNKLRGAFGETDFDKKVIRINKKRHISSKAWSSTPKRDRTLKNTILHEEIHAKHPRMLEKTVRKLARREAASISKKKMNKLYSRYR